MSKDLKEIPMKSKKIPSFLFFIFLILISQAKILMAADGDLDPSFGIKGTIVHDFKVNPIDAALQKDGSIIVAGGTAVVRFNDHGELQTNFDSCYRPENGLYRMEIMSVIIQPDGKIVVAGGGQVRNPSNTDSHYRTFALARFLPDGHLDPSFGKNGVSIIHSGRSDALIMKITLDPMGNILAAGVTQPREDKDKDWRPETLAILKIQPNGDIDTEFGRIPMLSASNGIVIRDSGEPIGPPKGIWTTKEGKILVVVGGLWVLTYSSEGLLEEENSNDLEFHFKGSGFRMSGWAFGRQDDGNFIIAGPWGKGFLSARYYWNLFMNSAYGGSSSEIASHSLVNFDDMAPEIFPPSTYGYHMAYPYSVAFQKDGKILIGGGVWSEGRESKYLLTRLNSNGTLDETFGNKGKVLTDFGSDRDYLYKLLVQPDGKIVAIGSSGKLENKEMKLSLARYLSTPPTLDWKKIGTILKK